MFKPLAVYASFAFIAIQVTDVVIKRLFFPDWIGTFVVILILIGFPVTFFLSWIYDITPEGIERTAHESTTNLPSSAKNTKKILLPITGILTIIGGTFWVFYSLGSLSHGADLDKKLFKSIAVLYLDNLSSNRQDENIGAALTQSIITSLSRLEIFDIKARTDVVQFRNKIYDHTEINERLGVDAYLDGSITRLPNSNELIANLALVDAYRGTNIWAGEFKKKADEILTIPAQIVSEVSKILGVDGLDIKLFSDEVVTDQENEDFSLFGKGINMLDAGQFENSIAIFDTIVQHSPDNRRAIYSRALAYEKQANYLKAIQDFSSIIEDGLNISKIKTIWLGSEKSILQHKPLFSYENDIQILISKNKDANKINVVAINTKTGSESWSWPYRTSNVLASIEDNYLIIRTASFAGKEATVYIHDISNNGAIVFSKEFSKTYNNEVVTISPVEYYHSGWLDNSGKNQNDNLILLNVRRDDSYAIVMVDCNKGVVMWEKHFNNTKGKIKMHSMYIDDDHYLLQKKGQYEYFYNAKTGNMIWENVLDNDKTMLALHNNKIVYFSQKDPYVTIVDPLSKNIIGEYTLDSPGYWWHRFNDYIIMETKRGLTSIKTYKPFLRSIHNWSFNLTEYEKFIKVRSLGENLFALTSENNLYCIDKRSGRVLNNTNLDVFGEVAFYYNHPEQPLVLSGNSFLIGIDPHNGNRLWKIRKQIDDWDDLVAFINNKLFIISRSQTNRDGTIDISAYNQTTGDLLWQANENVYKHCNNNCDLSLHNFDNRFVYIKTSHKINDSYSPRVIGPSPKDALHMLNLDWKPDKNYIPKDDLLNQLAKCYIKTGELIKAEDLLKQIIVNFDQQNELAYLQLSNMYLDDKRIDSYISTLANYYDLIKHNNTKKIRLESSLMDHANLQWVENLKKKAEMFVDIEEMSAVLVGNCEKGVGCDLSLYRSTTGIQIWHTKYSMIDHSLYIGNHDGSIILLGRKTPTEKDILGAGFTLGSNYPSSKINMPLLFLNINPQNGNIMAENSFLNHTSENLMLWNVYTGGNNIIADISLSNTNNSINTRPVRKIASINFSGEISWIKEYTEDKFMRMKAIDVIRYDSLIVVPLSETLEAVNVFDGSVVWEYDYTDDIDAIQYLTQSCLQNDSLAVLSEDNEFMLIALSSNPKLAFIDDIDFDVAGIVHYMDANSILWYNNNGFIALYEFDGDKFDVDWSKNIDRIYSIKSFANNIYIMDGYQGKVNVLTMDGDKINEFPLIWKPNEIFINDKFIGCFNDKKLYLLSI